MVSFKKSASERIVGEVREFHGKESYDIRQHYLLDGEFRPTKKGVSIPLDKAEEVLKRMLKEVQDAKG
jgi:hypothetical protein